MIAYYRYYNIIQRTKLHYIEFVYLNILILYLLYTIISSWDTLIYTPRQKSPQSWCYNK